MVLLGLKLTCKQQAAPARLPTVEECDATFAPQQVALTKRPNVECAMKARRTTEIEGGSIALAHNSTKAKPVSIGGHKRNYNPPATSQSAASPDQSVIRSVIGLAPLKCGLLLWDASS
jgi:hypothetical protein